MKEAAIRCQCAWSSVAYLAPRFFRYKASIVHWNSPHFRTHALRARTMPAEYAPEDALTDLARLQFSKVCTFSCSTYHWTITITCSAQFLNGTPDLAPGSIALIRLFVVAALAAFVRANSQSSGWTRCLAPSCSIQAFDYCLTFSSEVLHLHCVHVVVLTTAFR